MELRQENFESWGKVVKIFNNETESFIDKFDLGNSATLQFFFLVFLFCCLEEEYDDADNNKKEHGVYFLLWRQAIASVQF